MDSGKKFIQNTQASAVPLILFILSILVCGALYTLFFLEVALPNLKYLIPDSDSKTFILMGIYAIPIIITLVGVICLIKEGQKDNMARGYYR